MENFVTNAEANECIEELRKIVDDLIIVSDDGTAKTKPGVNRAQLLYAIREVEKIRDSFKNMKQKREEFNKELDQHFDGVEKARKSAQYFLDKYGNNFYPSWYKDMLRL